MYEDVLFDITWCVNKTCPFNGKCKRSDKYLKTLNPGERWLSFSKFEPKQDKCEHFLE